MLPSQRTWPFRNVQSCSQASWKCRNSHGAHWDSENYSIKVVCPLYASETLSDTDTAEGPGGAGLLALLALDLGRPEDARRLIDAHRDRLRQAPLAMASLAEGLERLG